MITDTTTNAVLDPSDGIETHDDPVFGPLTYFPAKPVLRRGDDAIYLRQDYKLPDYPTSVIDYLYAAASAHPDRLSLAERGPQGWDGPTFRQLKANCEAIAQALLNRGLKQGDCIAVLSRNSIIHAQILFGAMMAGITAASISPSYAKFSEAFPRLQSTFAQSKAKLFFVDDAQTLSDALDKLDLSGCELVSEHPRPGDTDVAELLGTKVTEAVAAAHAAVTEETVGKILFTSGSTGNPKGVINTQRMMCANIAMSQRIGIRIPHAQRRRLCWLPWHHTFGGNHILHEMLFHASALYIDSGRPVSGPDFERSLTAIREVKPTNFSNVPLAYGMLLDAMEQDTELAEAFFSNLTFVHYGGAGFPGETYERLQKLAMTYRGCRIPLSGGFAMTEAAPSVTTVHWPYDGVGRIGMPVPEVEIKLIPLSDDRYELRIKGPNVFPGYVDQPELNKRLFDDEGFFITGDAIRFENIDNIANDLRYAGRVSEDFKLDSGTFVQVGAIRTGLNLECGGLVRDTVVVGEGRAHIVAMVWLNDAARARATRVDGALIEPAPEDLAQVQQALDRWNQNNGGSSRQVRAIGILAEPPSLSENEINDKGYVNQRQVLKRRAEIVDALYNGTRNDWLVVAQQ
ncbi:2-succinylbenzoate--CoA ligase [Ruegeria sp. THAF57]|uniref:AMP-binding protein n=1 Tax=Ruegeria sp. THAF57 TaxID=2744555 RepID=UPI0015E04427|nr:AMP-binding protein [Ruegeria sp. THAF57]CAD0183901.1 2-succinylbenzoate--CoA ligase [Ruegeria sp. THAF57]